MLRIDGTTIYLSKGNTADLTVSVFNDANENAYDIQENDTIVMTVRRAPDERSPIVIQKVVKGASDIHLEPEDTDELVPRTYKYDVELRNDDNVYTVIPCSDFVLLPGVTTP